MINRKRNSYWELHRHSCVKNNRKRYRVNNREKSGAYYRATLIHRENNWKWNRVNSGLRGYLW